MTEPKTREEQLARDNVGLYRRLTEKDAQIRRRDVRISELKLELERLVEEAR